MGLNLFQKIKLDNAYLREPPIFHLLTAFYEQKIQKVKIRSFTAKP